MFIGAALVGVHMAATHGISLAMLSSYIPATAIPGLGRVSGTAWSFTDFVLGACNYRVSISLRSINLRIFILYQGLLYRILIPLTVDMSPMICLLWCKG